MAQLIAYLDPGAGSIVLQMILAGILGLSYTLKTYWRRIVAFVRRDQPKDKGPDAPAPLEENP
ncbi:hypothetical protein ESB00_10125 [Oleiharenicola lentus]|jgi:hypothetical protein|uniref:Uncharacterized protein n=1 Tax=Oleiharenicola lentus TaxID=2508720 RepID=A0A4Q1CAU4_9BACT|nr:hypothetical protein [Oleiharenicola lentus]RXK56205.1 hypothetical protein ESB00_10125 [Oleiharenicola lentus]